MAGMVRDTVKRSRQKIYAGGILIVVYYLLVWEIEWYLLPVILISILVWKRYLYAKERWEAAYQGKRKLQEFLESFEFFYQTHQTIEAALEELSEQYPMVRELAVYRRLTGERVKQEKEPEDIHLRVFFLLLEFYSDYGRGESFLKGIRLMKECIEEEIMLELRRKQLFAGGFLLMLSSLLVIKPIQAWAEKNVAELSVYYNGIQGRVTMLLCLGVIFLTARILIWLCFEQMNQKKQISKSIVWVSEREWVQRWLRKYIRFFKKHYVRLYSFICYVGYAGDCQKFLLKQMGRSGTCLGVFLILGGGIRKTAGFWGILVFAVLLAWISPYTELLLCWYQVEFIREQEILYLQTILLAAKEMEQIGAEELNHWLIRASDYFRRVFLSLSGRLEFVREEEILEQSEGKKDIFYHILEGLAKGRDFGWKKIFSGIEGEQMFLKQRNYQKREKRLENEGSVGRILVMVPAVFILISWLILPFVSEGLQQLGYYAQSMQGL